MDLADDAVGIDFDTGLGSLSGGEGGEQRNEAHCLEDHGSMIAKWGVERKGKKRGVIGGKAPVFLKLTAAPAAQLGETTRRLR